MKAGKSALIDQRASGLLLLGAAIATLAVTPWYNFDPINPVKQMVVSIVAFALLGLLWGNWIEFARSWVLKLYSIYLCSMLIPFVLSGAPFAQQIWGTFGRNTGFLIYFSAAIISIASYLVASEIFVKRFITYSICTTGLVTIYCVFQALGMDPIKWSAQDIFATLGNVNFLSAFLGVQSVLILSLALFSSMKLLTRLFFFSFLIVDLILIIRTDSIQGAVVFVAGFYLILLFRLIKVGNRKIALGASGTWIIAGISGVILGVQGLLGQGPLKTILFQSTTYFRADYMAAAWNTFIKHILTGVGFDSFDNWYRTERGFISAYRTGPNRTTNSAHNVFLDIAANGGVLMFALYLMIVGSTFVLGFRKILKSEFNYRFIGIFAAWCAFILQSAISINQIGLSVWGWILTGLVLGLSNSPKKRETLRNEDFTEKGRKAKATRNSAVQLLPAGIALRTILIGSIGGILAFLPMKADADFVQARKKGDLNKLVAASQEYAATSFHISMTIDMAKRGNYPDIAKQMSDLLIARYPREFYGWQFRIPFDKLTEQDRQLAYQKIKELDPYFACAEPTPSLVIRGWFNALPEAKKFELVRWWGLSPFAQTELPKGDWLTPISSKIDDHIKTYCGA